VIAVLQWDPPVELQALIDALEPVASVVWREPAGLLQHTCEKRLAPSVCAQIETKLHD